MVEDHQLTILSGIGLPGGKSVDVGIAIVGKLGPDTAHHIGQFQIGGCGLWQFVGGVMKGVETELQLVAMDGTVVNGGAPGEHIHVEGPFDPFDRLRDRLRSPGVGGDEGFGTEEPVDADEILRGVGRIGFGEGLDIGIGLVSLDRKSVV